MNYNSLMQRCIDLGNSALGFTYPNPNVGALIFKNGKIIGEGFTGSHGKNHAEINAIESVNNKDDLKDSTLFVTLEPCSHYGKTPPCSKKIIESKIKTVVIGCKDPNILVNGSGIEMLKNNNLNVQVGILEKKCFESLKRFMTFQKKNRPYIILKWAESIDGIISPNNKNDNRPVWISNEISRQLVHKWRSQEHAILVGSKTIDSDNPILDSRNWNKNNPIKVIIGNPKKRDKNAKYIFNDYDLEIKTITKYLYEKNIQSVLVEGGKKTLDNFINNGIWDEARIFKSEDKMYDGISAPKIIGLKLYEKKIKKDTLSVLKNY